MSVQIKKNGVWEAVAGNATNTSGITESSALANIGTAANATQHDVNVAIDSAIKSTSKYISSTLQSPGWYKICEIGAENIGCALEVDLGSMFNNTNGCSHVIKLAYGYQACNMLELSQDGYYVFSGIRFVHIDDYTKNMVLVYYSLNKENDCYAMLKSSLKRDFTAFNFVPVDASQYSKYIEFSLGNNGAYVNGKKLATVN